MPHVLGSSRSVNVLKRRLGLEHIPRTASAHECTYHQGNRYPDLRLSLAGSSFVPLYATILVGFIPSPLRKIVVPLLGQSGERNPTDPGYLQQTSFTLSQKNFEVCCRRGGGFYMNAGKEGGSRHRGRNSVDR